MNILGPLVVAQAEIHRMAELRVGGPLGESDLRHELRPYPVRPLVGFRLDPEWRRRYFERCEQLHQSRQLLLVEAGAGVSDIVERPLVEDAEQQRAEIRSRMPRF